MDAVYAKLNLRPLFFDDPFEEFIGYGTVHPYDRRTVFYLSIYTGLWRNYDMHHEALFKKYLKDFSNRDDIMMVVRWSLNYKAWPQSWFDDPEIIKEMIQGDTDRFLHATSTRDDSPWKITTAIFYEEINLPPEQRLRYFSLSLNLPIAWSFPGWEEAGRLLSLIQRKDVHSLLLERRQLNAREISEAISRKQFSEIHSLGQ